MSSVRCGLAALLVCCSILSKAQDDVRLGLGADFNATGKIVQTISIDLNRSEKVDEKVNRYFLFDRRGYFIQPSADINFGEKVTSSENNITLSLNMGRVFYGQSKQVTWHKSLELIPTYSSDKNFNERLGYGQFKAAISAIKGHTTTKDADTFVNRRWAATAGLFSNLGDRKSKTFDDHSFYAAGGALSEVKWIWRKRPKNKKEDPYTNWQLKVSGKAYYLFSELSALYDKNFAGALQASIDKKFVRLFYLGLTYKYGNDNPTYKEIHTLDLGLKFNY